jgi:hypothetical protein
MLDGLSDNLNEAVVAAVKQAVEVAVQEAVRGVLVELLTNPELLSRLRSVVDLPGGIVAGCSESSLKRTACTSVAKLCTCVGRCGQAVAQACARRLQPIRHACGSVVRQIGTLAASTWWHCQLVRRFTRQILVATLVGAVIGSGAYFAGPSLAAAASGLGGSAYDQLNATGTVNLTGATLNVSLLTAVPLNSSLTIIQASTAVTGTFTNLPNGATIVVGGESFQITYGTKSVVLTRVG